MEALRDLADAGGEVWRTAAPAGKGANGGGFSGEADMVGDFVIVIVIRWQLRCRADQNVNSRSCKGDPRVKRLERVIRHLLSDHPIVLNRNVFRSHDGDGGSCGDR